MIDPLDAARALIAAGAPVWTAPPAAHWTPGSGKLEFYLPKAWNRLPADEACLAGYRPGYALCMTAGHVFDVVDIDVKNGADVEAERDGLIEFGVRILGEVRTPSGGAHFYVNAAGLKSSANTARGVDYKGGSESGEGRGFVFLPGTQRRKYPGAEYQWVAVPNVGN